MSLRTPLCDLLGVDVPILQAGMGGYAGAELAAAVSEAGGLGILGGHATSADELREMIAQTRALTNRPFGVNLLLAEDHRHPAPASGIGDADAVQAVLNPMRSRLGLPAKHGLPPAPVADLGERIEVVLEARVPVLSVGLGSPSEELVGRCHLSEVKVIAMAASAADAVTFAAAGVDAIVAQGSEAGGHRSHVRKPNDPGVGAVGTVALVPEVVDAVEVPVIAAGGIADGRGLVAALALGAQGAMLGTRFLATREALAGAAYKRALIDASGDATTVTDVASGRYARLIRNAFIEEYGDAPVLPFGWQGSAVSDLFQGARERENPDGMGLWAGQSVGLIRDLPPAGEVVARIVAEANATLARLLGR
jgi:nitronate monooxygenase